MSAAMKKTLFLMGLLLAVPIITSAQTQTRERRSRDAEPFRGQSTAVRDRVVAPIRVANHAEKAVALAESPDQAVSSSTSALVPKSKNAKNQSVAQPSWGKTTFVVRSALNQRINPFGDATPDLSKGVNQEGARKLVQRTALVAAVPPLVSSPAETNTNSRKALSRALVPTVAYRVGIGDVLDIRLANFPTRESTLFTVLRNGVLEYPLLSGPLAVAGLTTDEIARLLGNEIKVINAARVSVSVRDYASHAVVVTGLVDSPGRKALRREAMPLYAVLAEALPRPEASVAILVRAGKEQTVALNNEQAMATLVLPDDIIKISGGTTLAARFIYVGGNVASPGEKEFRSGMTLTQALLSAGGVSRNSKTSVKVARRNGHGFLISNEYNLRAIEEGKAEDPLLEAGDRIEVTRGL
jgi:protein involved in polysaccharide export with SLBB domain